MCISIKLTFLWYVQSTSRYRKLVRYHILSTHSIKVGKKWIPIIARIIQGVIPVLMGINYKDCNAEDPNTQHKLGKLNIPKIFFLRGKEAPTPNVTVKRLAHIHMDMENADHTQMVMECKRLGSKMSKSMELKISKVIQECITCRHKDTTFTQGKGKKYKVLTPISLLEENQ